ncbi:MAG: hypothetical protein QOH51_106 [Acidobacteriota bacterium]|jgi:hypothetical protein|nr:hypothetical protein [Acidobacteriota bacterium]
MLQLKLIVGAWLLDGARWARANLYALVVLTPLVLGMTYFGVGRMVREAEWSPTESETLAASLVATACLVALSLSRACVEIYHVRRPEWVLDALPVSAASQLSAALLRRMAHTCAVGVAALVLRWLAGGGVFDWSVLALVVLLVSVLASGEVLAALEWVHWAHRRGRVQAAVAFMAFSACTASGGLLLAEIVRPGGLTLLGRTSLLACGAVATTALAAVAIVLHGSWRAADAEFAKRLGARDTWGDFVEGAARRVCSSRGADGTATAVAAQLARDMRLTLRGFSSAVYAAAGVASLVVVLLVALLVGGVVPEGEGGGWASATWLPRVLAVKFACVLASATMTALLPVLVAHQRPHLWLERSVGLKGEDAWRAKLYFARVLTLPVPFATWAAGILCGAVPGVYALPLLAECAWLWWMVSTIAGGLAFEMPDEPGLALILTLCAALAAGGLTAFVWPVGLAIYALGVQPLCMRGVVRANAYLKGEGS